MNTLSVKAFKSAWVVSWSQREPARRSICMDGAADQWSFVAVDLEDFSGQWVEFRLRFGTEGQGGPFAWRLDDIAMAQVEECPPILVFSDGFESADLGRWSPHVPQLS